MAGNWGKQGGRSASPSWPPTLWISPTKLKTYSACPHKARLQYVDKLRVSQPYSLFMEEGKVAHSMLADIARRIKVGAELRSEDELLDWATRGLKPDAFPSEPAREASARKIVRWVKVGLAHLDREATFLNIENPGNRSFPLRAQPDLRLTIALRPDLILLRTDADGDPFVEIVDYKTGAVWIDEIPPVAMRFVFKTLFQTIATNPLAMPMQFTYVFLDHGQTEVIPLTPDSCAEAWNNVLSLAQHLIDEREWPAKPSGLCHYCAYAQFHCPAAAALNREDDAF